MGKSLKKKKIPSVGKIVNLFIPIPWGFHEYTYVCICFPVFTWSTAETTEVLLSVLCLHLNRALVKGRLTLSQTTNFRLFQTQRLSRRQF